MREKGFVTQGNTFNAFLWSQEYINLNAKYSWLKDNQFENKNRVHFCQKIKAV